MLCEFFFFLSVTDFRVGVGRGRWDPQEVGAGDLGCVREGGRHREGALGRSRKGVWDAQRGGAGKGMCFLALALLDHAKAKFIHGTAKAGNPDESRGGETGKWLQARWLRSTYKTARLAFYSGYLGRHGILLVGHPQIEAV